MKVYITKGSNNIHKSFTLIVFWSTLTVVGAEAGTTYVSGVIDTNTVWTPAGSPYVVIDTTIVDSGIFISSIDR